MDNFYRLAPPEPEEPYSFGERVLNRFGIGPEAQFYQQQGLTDPRAVAWSQALQNIATMNLGGIPRVDPAGAASVERRRNMELQNRRMEQARRSELLTAEVRRMTDPHYDYNSAVAQGLIDPEKVSLVDYMTIGQRNQLPAAALQEFALWEQNNPQGEGESDDDYADRRRTALDNILNPPVTFDMGGGGLGSLNRTSGGSSTTLVRPGDATARDASREGAITTASGNAQMGVDNTAAAIEAAYSAQTAYDDASSMLAASNEFLAMLENNDVDTGFISSLLLNTFGVGSQELAALNNESIMQGLRNLGIANLAPVTEQEFAAVLKLWADIGMESDPNIGSVKRAIKRTERLQSRIRTDLLREAERVRTWGGEGAYNNLVRTNDLLRGMIGDADVGGSESEDGSVRRK